MKDIDIAVELLKVEKYTLVIVKGNKVIFTSKEKGIKPLYFAIKEYKFELKGASIADRVTGKAAAMLCVYSGIKHLKTNLISDSAINILNESDVIYGYDVRTPYIKNKDKTEMCPVETIALKSNDINEFLEEIVVFLEMIKEL